MKYPLSSIFLFILLLFYQGSSQAIDYCGDGLCRPPLETAVSCPVDCGGIVVTPSCNTCTNGACSLPGSGVDQDSEGIPDRLEYQLAHRFFPNLWMRDHPQDKDVFYGTHANNAFNTTIPYRVSFAPNNSNLNELCSTENTTCLEVRFGLAYDEDFGDGVWPFSSVGNHIGDSEFAAYILRTTVSWSEAQTDPGAWHVAFSRLNHHESNTITGHHSCTNVDQCLQYTTPMQCFNNTWQYGCSWNSTGVGGISLCQSMNGSSQQVCGGPTSPLTIWASEKKHASYPTQNICNNSGFGGGTIFGGADDCSENDFNARAEVTAGNRLQNIGELINPIDSTISAPKSCHEYQILDNTDFANSSPYFGKFFYNLGW